MANTLITANRVTGTPVFDPAGERIGHIEDLSIDKASGKVACALLSFGGFLGLDEHCHPLPWSVLKYDTAKDGYIVPLDKAQLKTAPAYTKDDLEAFGGDDHRYREALFSYYGAAPYW